MAPPCRYDLLNQLYRACGMWDKALEVADKHDRIHLKSTHFAYAQVRQGRARGGGHSAQTAYYTLCGPILASAMLPSQRTHAVPKWRTLPSNTHPCTLRPSRLRAAHRPSPDFVSYIVC